MCTASKDKLSQDIEQVMSCLARLRSNPLLTDKDRRAVRGMEGAASFLRKKHFDACVAMDALTRSLPVGDR